MSDQKSEPARANKLDRPSEHLVFKNTQHAPWHDDGERQPRDKSQHRRYHGLFEDLLN